MAVLTQDEASTHYLTQDPDLIPIGYKVIEAKQDHQSKLNYDESLCDELFFTNDCSFKVRPHVL